MLYDTEQNRNTVVIFLYEDACLPKKVFIGKPIKILRFFFYTSLDIVFADVSFISYQ